MKLDSAKSVWAGRGVTWLILAGISCGIIFLSSFMLGPALFSGDAVGRRLAVTAFCPGAVSTVEQQGVSTQTTTSPTGPYGHTVEITCTMPDGSTQTIRNEQYALAAIGGMFGGGALCGLGLSLPLFLIPFLLIRRKKNESAIQS